MNIAILYGGTSPERDASEENARAIQKALAQRGHTSDMVEFSPDCISKLARPYDRAFIAAPGKHHGDGACQSLCELLRLPYTGTKAADAAVINNKVLCKKLCAYHGIPTARFFELEESGGGLPSQTALHTRIAAAFGYPAVAKAATQGGSFGIVYLGSELDLPRVQRVFDCDDTGLAEEFLDGQFVTVGVLEEHGIPVALPALSAVTKSVKEPLQLFDKAFSIVSPTVSRAQEAKLRETALQIFRLFKARSYARIDFMFRKQDETPYFLEINAVPGLGPKSFFPEAAKRYGYDLPTLCSAILQEGERYA